MLRQGFIRPQQPFAPVSREYAADPIDTDALRSWLPRDAASVVGRCATSRPKSSSATVEALGVLLFDYFSYNNIKKGLGFRDV